MKLDVGGIAVHVLHEGCFRLDGGAMFGVVPRVVWAKHCPPDAENRIRLGLNQLLVRGRDYLALIDAGIGDKFDSRQRQMYGVEKLASWPERLRPVGVRVEEITHVVLTHLHFDHAGGATELSNDGREVRPVFPRARYYVQETEWEDACHPNERNRASYLSENYLPLKTAGRLVLINGDQEIADGLHVTVTGGHCRGHQAVMVRSAGRSVFFPADLFPTSRHLRVAWNMGYDLFPLDVVRGRRNWLRELIAEGIPVLFEHDPEPAFFRVRGTVEQPTLERLAV